MRETVFLTGGTGFLGVYLLRRLLQHNNHTIGHIVVLCRGKTQKEAERRMQQSLWDQSPLRQKRGCMSLLEVVRGDITQENLGLSKEVYNRLTKEVTLIYHSAALCEFNIPLSVIRKINLDGTKNLLELALSCWKKGKFKCFNHISTIAVAGEKEEVFYERDLDLGQKFNNTYEQTKFEAEKLAEEYRKREIPITTFRPAVIIGDSKTGYTSNFRMFYQPLHLFFLELFKEIPADRNSLYSLCPVDYVAEAIIRISLDNNANKNLTCHITNPNMVSLDYLIDTASRYFKFQKPLLLPKEKFYLKKLSPLQFSLLEPFIPYLNYKLKFDARNSQSILIKTNFKWPKIDEVFLKRLFKFCIRSGFIKPGKTR